MEEGEPYPRFLSPLRRGLGQLLFSSCCAGRWSPPGPTPRRAVVVGGNHVTVVCPQGMSGVGIEAITWGLWGLGCGLLCLGGGQG